MPWPPPGDLPNLGIEPKTLKVSCIARRFFINWAIREALVFLFVCMCVLVAQSGSTLCDLMDCGLPGSSVHGISQAKILEWVAISSPRDVPKPGIGPVLPDHLLHWQVDSPPLSHQGRPMCSVQLLSRVRLFAIPWTAARQASLSLSPTVCSNSCPLSL